MLSKVDDDTHNQKFEYLEKELFPNLVANTAYKAEKSVEAKQRAIQTKQFFSKIFSFITKPFKMLRDWFYAKLKIIMWIGIALLGGLVLALVLWLLFGKYRIQDKIKRAIARGKIKSQYMKIGAQRVRASA